MSDAHHDHHDDSPHHGPIKTPKQLVLAVFFAFVVPIAAIVLLVMYVGSEKQPNAGSDAANAEVVARRIRPVGTVEVKDVSDPASLKSGEQVYTAQCSACHAAAVAGAPKFADAAAWGPRLGQGYDTLLLHALKNAAVPIITVIGIGIALLISGVVITETVFNIPGLGRLTVDAVLKRDYPVVQGLILVFAAAKVLVNLIIDISYAFLDPRIRY